MTTAAHPTTDGLRILLLGASGLTGGYCLEALVAKPDVARVIAPVRRPLAISNAKLDTPTVDYEQLQQYPELFEVDAVICCLGTTLRKAGSRQAFRRVDCEYVVSAATEARHHGVDGFLVISAVGASANSGVYYNRVKGEMEDTLKALGFPALRIYHPGLLMGERQESRAAEGLAQRVMPALNTVLLGGLKKFRGIEARELGRALANEAIYIARAADPGKPSQVRFYQDILEWAGAD